MAWKKLEQFNTEKYPKCIKALLVSAGYDTLSSLSGLDDVKIRKIENFHNENKEYVAQLDCCFHEHYTQVEKFVFLPGHQSIILGIPEQIINLKSVNKSQTVRCAPLTRKKSHSDEQLVKNLIDNLMKYTGKAGYQFPDGLLSKDNIQEFKRGSAEDNFVCKCKFSCPFCSRIISTVHKTFWMSSNITQHFKTHINEEIVDIEKEWTCSVVCWFKKNM